MKASYLLSVGLCIVLVQFLSITPVYPQIVIGEGHYKIETYEPQSLIICNQLPSGVGPFQTIQFGSRIFQFATPAGLLKRGLRYNVTEPAAANKAYRLWFSGAPIVDITILGGKRELYDNFAIEIPGGMTVTDTIGLPYTSDIGIRFRGASSLTFAKKSYRVQLRQPDPTSEKGWANKDESLLGMRNDKRWLLLALYNEKLRLNNKVSHELWMDMHKLYYLDKEPDAKSTISTRYVNVFIEGKYAGIFLFTENTDRKQLKLKKEDGGLVRGELYKSGDWGVPHQFVTIPANKTGTTWAGWELEYPDVIDWQNFRSLSEFAQNTSDEDFKNQLATRVRVDNMQDYILYVNLLRALDNLGKNLFLAKYKEGEPYFYGVWDLDGTWGYNWDGARGNEHRGFISNDFFQKAMRTNPGNFNARLARRWFNLRSDLLSNVNVLKRFNDQYDYLKANGLYALEGIAEARANASGPGWDFGWLSTGADELGYLQNWVTSRLAWMDTYMEQYVDNSLPLPVELVNFEGSREGNITTLRWTTQAEKNSKDFVLEKSRDTRIWETIGTIPAKGNSGYSVNYQFSDHLGGHGVIFYRLKIRDLDDSFELSRIISLDMGKGTRLQVHPNPAADYVTALGGPDSKMERIELVNAFGQSIYSELVSGNQKTIQVANLRGMYFVRAIYADGCVENRKILIE